MEQIYYTKNRRVDTPRNLQVCFNFYIFLGTRCDLNGITSVGIMPFFSFP